MVLPIKGSLTWHFTLSVTIITRGKQFYYPYKCIDSRASNQIFAAGVAAYAQFE